MLIATLNPTHSFTFVYFDVCLQSDIYDVIRQVFTAAAAQPAPKGIGHSPQSRAIYGIDIMLQWMSSEEDGKSHSN